MVGLAGVDQPSANARPARGREHRVCSEGWADGGHRATDAGCPLRTGESDWFADSEELRGPPGRF